MGDRAGRFEQLPDLADRAPGIVALGGENGGLGGRGKLRLPPVDARLRRQSVDALRSPGVVPRLNRLLAQMTAARAGDGVFASGQFPDDLLQFATLEPFAAGQRAQDR